MFNRKKRILKKPIKLDYHSLNPFLELKNDSLNNLNIKKDDRMIDENEWRIEYEMIYSSYQIER